MSTSKRAHRPDRKGLDRQQVIKAALRIVDEQGLDGLSMRRLADELGIKPMSLYSHIDNKDDLIDGIVVEVLSEVQLPASDSWEDALRGAFQGYRDALLRHPHTAEIIMRRPVHDAERFLGVLDFTIGVLRGAGLDAPAALHFHRILTAFTTGLVLNEATSPDPLSDPVVLWSRHLGGDRFPNVGAAMPTILERDFDQTFELGLDLLIDAVKTYNGRPQRKHRPR